MKFRGGAATGETVLGDAQPIDGFREPGQVKEGGSPRTPQRLRRFSQWNRMITRRGGSPPRSGECSTRSDVADTSSKVKTGLEFGHLEVHCCVEFRFRKSPAGQVSIISLAGTHMWVQRVKFPCAEFAKCGFTTEGL